MDRQLTFWEITRKIGWGLKTTDYRNPVTNALSKTERDRYADILQGLHDQLSIAVDRLPATLRSPETVRQTLRKTA